MRKFHATAGGGGTAKRSTVVRFQASEGPATEEAMEGGGVNTDAGNGGHGLKGHPLHESHSAPALNHLTASAPNPRRGSIAAGLSTGNRRASVVAGNLLKQLQVMWPAGEKGWVMGLDL
jgi:hypothetical protein